MLHWLMAVVAAWSPIAQDATAADSQDLRLPKEVGGEVVTADAGLEIAVDAEGRLHVGRAVHSLDTISTVLLEWRKKAGSAEALGALRLRCDQCAPAEDVLQLVALAAEEHCGADRIQFVTRAEGDARDAVRVIDLRLPRMEEPGPITEMTEKVEVRLHRSVERPARDFVFERGDLELKVLAQKLSNLDGLQKIATRIEAANAEAAWVVYCDESVLVTDLLHTFDTVHRATETYPLLGMDPNSNRRGGRKTRGK